ncbi:MAG TPA: excinuclease ABC subunit UvrC [Nitrospirae bacterium]|nr:UvrABC system protein C [bacterium BMS3Bbin09]HDO66908.1 excinuclease ABC subunit UvrC [Nitrospirota bacterium]HEW81082.1 excinuclease ABC subunit UvrC [Nitrospirota bacterium]
MNFRKKLEKVPTFSGIYIMKGAKERVLYVGKAKNLRNRLRSYFQDSASLGARKSKMVDSISDFEYVVTKNELEALVLEANFIKRAKPPYNIILRDDKNYPYLRLTVNEDWPRLDVSRRIGKDGALYFGPYVPSGPMREMLKFIRRNFPVRMCRYDLKKTFRPCVQFQMKKCLAPCSKDLRTKEYRARYLAVVDDLRSFIKGEQKELLKNLDARMMELSNEERYEEAAVIRDRQRALESTWESQRVIAPELGDLDVIGLYREKSEASVFILFIRNGMAIGQKDFFLKRLDDIGDEEIITSFMEQFYLKDMFLPPAILLPLKASIATQKKWLSEKKGSSVKIVFPRAGQRAKVLKLANDNAFYAFNKHKETRVDETLLQIKEFLKLRTVPKRIAAIDISNTSGSEAVGALIMFEDGKFIKDDYRRFKIKTVKGANDFAMIGEVVGRYMKKMSDEGGELPDLFLIDGGRGQLDFALNAMKPFDLDIDVAGIAKAKSDAALNKKPGIRRDLDRIYLPDKKRPVYLEPFMPSTHLLQKIRDEVHRFAITYHRKLRSKRILESPLEKIAGIGKAKRLLLLKHFKSIDAIRRASIEEIAEVKGINKKVAAIIKKGLG